MTKTFCYPKLGRAGLGNCMLPWARAVVFARKNSLPILAPQWVQPRFGAVLRREKVKRFYLTDFTNQGYIAGLRKWFVLSSANKVGEDTASQFLSAGCKAGIRSSVIVFEGLKNYFCDIWHDHAMVREELYNIVSPLIQDKVGLIREPFIAMHVRRGDVNLPQLQKKHFTPLSWFVDAAKTLREEAAWRELPIYVISDGREHELTELLAISNCQLITSGTAIGDILLLAKARFLFGSAHSTFSMWGSYLGRVPALYYPGKMDQKVFPPDLGIFEGEWREGQVLPKLQTNHHPRIVV